MALSMHGDNSVLFRKYVEGREKAVFPWSLSIVDCFFISSAFLGLEGAESVKLLRVSDGGNQAETSSIANAYDLYEMDTEAGGFEVVLLHETSGSLCYWDVHERFVVAVGGRAFLGAARPYPVDIERHRYVEAMLHLAENGGGELPEVVYDALSTDSAG